MAVVAPPQPETSEHAVKARPLFDRAIVRQAIVDGQLSPGQRLTERELTDRMEVSRTLVREALRQLESEGLITVVPNRGPVVSRVTPEQAEGIYQVRCVLEGLASELFAAHASEEDQRALRQALRKGEISSTELTRDVLTRIERADGALRAAPPVPQHGRPGGGGGEKHIGPVVVGVIG